MKNFSSFNILVKIVILCDRPAPHFDFILCMILLIEAEYASLAIMYLNILTAIPSTQDRINLHSMSRGTFVRIQPKTLPARAKVNLGPMDFISPAYRPITAINKIA